MLAVDHFAAQCRTAQFCLGILMRCCFWTPPSPQTPNAATLRVGLCMSPGVQYHPVNIYLKPDESSVYIGIVRFHDSSRFRKKAGDAKILFCASFVLVVESGVTK